jgi:hypothetical protein
VTITAPNGTQPIWSFDETQPAGTTSDVYVASSPKLPSRLVLPVVPLTTVGSAQPTCPSLRNEPCRPAVPFTNTSFPQ